MQRILRRGTIRPFVIALFVAAQASANLPEEPEFSFVQESDEDDYFIHFTDEGSDALSILQAQQAADAIARGGNAISGNPKGYHDGYVALGFSEPYFSGDRDVFYWDCKVSGDPDCKGCDNGQAYASRINVPTTVYSALINVEGSSKSEQCNRIMLGHELFHHVEFGYVFEASDGADDGCGPWPAAACEGHARMLQDHIYTDVDFAITGGCLATQSAAANYLSDPGGTLWEYSYDTALFWKYLAQRYGDMQTEPTAGADFIAQWWENALDGYDTPDIIQLTRDTIQDFGGVGVDAAFHDFSIANVAKDYDLTLLSASNQARWSYIDEEQGFAQDDYGSVQIFFDPTISPGNPFSSQLGPDQYGTVYAQARVGECPIGSVLRFTAEQDDVQLAEMSLLVIRGDQVVDVHKKVGTSWNLSRTQPLPRYGRLIAPVSGLTDDVTMDTEFRCSTSQTEFPIANRPRPTHGGEVNDFAIVPVDVEVFDPDGPIPGLQAEDFAVEIGDPPSAVAAPVRGVIEAVDGYKVLIEMPASVGVGSHPLRLHLGANEVSADDVILRGPRLPDQIVLLDRSASMGQSAGTQSRLDTTRRAASFYASLLEVGVGAGVGSMANDGDDDAAIEIPLDVTDEAHRAALRAAIAAIGPPQGSTPIGDALALAAREFGANGATNQERHVLLLSDGGQGGGSNYDAVRSALQDSGAHVHAIAIGEDADQGLLAAIAFETGGSYDFVPLPLPSFGFANALADAFARVAERAAGRSRIASIEGAIRTNAPIYSTQFTIAETGLSDVVVAFHWEEPSANLNLVLIRPNGVTVVDGVGGARIAHEATHIVMQLPSLEPGTWQIVASGTGQPTFIGSASARTGDGVYVLTSVQHRADAPAVSDRAGAFAAQLPAAIATALYDATGPILGADVEVEVVHPEIDDQVLVAFNHGELDDDRADDGIYTALFRATNDSSPTGLPDQIGNGEPGSYRVRVTTSGTDNGGHVFQRLTESAFWVGLGDAVDGDGDGMLDRYEALHPCLASAANDATNDRDGDQLGAGLERLHGTDPCRSDTDGGGENDGSEVARGGHALDPGDDLLPAPGYFALVTHVSEHVDDTPRFVPQPLANLLRIPSAPQYATVRIERRGSPTAPWIQIAQIDPRALGGAYSDSGLSEGVTFEYRMRGLDAAGHQSAVSRVVQATVKQDPVAPIGALRIDTPAPRTDSSAIATLVDFYFDSELGMEMKLWWADEAPPRSWEPIATQRFIAVDAVAAPTLRTLLLQLRDAAGNESIRYADAVHVYPPNSLGAARGAVQRRDGSAPGGVVVQLPGLPGDGPIVTAADGSFELVDLPSGSYDITFFDGENTTTLPGVAVVAGSPTQLGTLLIPEPNALAAGAVALLALREVARLSSSRRLRTSPCR